MLYTARMRGTIYALAEPDSMDIRYCGKTVKLLRDRMYNHEGDAYRLKSRHVCNWLRKVYDAGQKPAVIVCEELELSGYTRRDQLRHLNERERAWIEQFKSLGFRLTNATKGGDGCHGRVVSAETREKAAKSNRGKKRSPEECERNRQAGLARARSTFLRGAAHQHFGKPQTWRDGEARKQKIREHWRRPEVRAAHSERMKGTMSPEELQKQSERHKGNKHAARITSEQALAIKHSVGTHTSVAKVFGVSRELVGLIRRGKLWKELP